MSEQIVASLTAEQRRVLLAMQPSTPTDVWRLSWRLKNLSKLTAVRVIEPGQRGWVDARLTDLGIQVRADLARSAH